MHRKGEEGAQAAPVTLPKQPLPRAQSSPVLWPQPPPPSQLLQCWDHEVAELLWITASFISIIISICYGTWWIIKRIVMGKCGVWVCFSSFCLSRFKAPLWECPYCIPNLSWNKVPALWGAVLHLHCFFLPTLTSISLTGAVMGKALWGLINQVSFSVLLLFKVLAIKFDLVRKPIVNYLLQVHWTYSIHFSFFD